MNNSKEENKKVYKGEVIKSKSMVLLRTMIELIIIIVAIRNKRKYKLPALAV